MNESKNPQLTRDIPRVKMQKILVWFFVFLALATDSAFGTVGVKGGHRKTATNNSSSLHTSHTANNTGLCYMRVPYSHWVALNGTNTTARPVSPLPRYPTLQAHQPWVTLVDCCEGLTRNPSTGLCEAHCENGCQGGRCVGPNICSCEIGWNADVGVCKPVCSQPCRPHAYCFAPEQCICELGYNSIDNECKPECPGGCINGECIAPRTCRCRRGFTLTEQKICAPVCEGGCPNGECTAPGVCTCYRGYVNPPGETEACLPDCPGGCSNGVCTSPGVCTCRSGYSRDAGGQCIPECQGGCQNGRCVGRNQCECHPGYILNPQSGLCIAGTCERPCLNGECTGMNICTCRSGYTLDPTDPTRSRCIASCPGGCPNGVCSGPNFCICNPGFVKDRSVKGAQRCVRRG